MMIMSFSRWLVLARMLVKQVKKNALVVFLGFWVFLVVFFFFLPQIASVFLPTLKNKKSAAVHVILKTSHYPNLSYACKGRLNINPRALIRGIYHNEL